MNKVLVTATTLSLLFSASTSFGFGKSKMKVAEIRGITETQFAKGAGTGQVLVRGKAAEVLYGMIRNSRPAKTDSAALPLMGKSAKEHWLVKGKQISCAKILSKAKGKDDYACAFELDEKGNVEANVAPFSPETFNLAKTETGIRIKGGKKAAGRSLASVATPDVAYSKSDAYLMYDEPSKREPSEEALIVFRGESAKEILHFLAAAPNAKKHTFFGGPKGVKGKEIACVAATKKEPDRCALVVTMRDGSISRSANPLFR